MHADEAKVRAFITGRIQKDVKANSALKARHRADLHNLQFYRGGEDYQWTVWDPNQQNYVPQPTGSTDDALPEWFFKATTNLFAVKIDGICSLLNQSEPAQEFAPAREQESDRAAAEVAEAAAPVLWDESGYKDLRAQLHKLIALTNAAALHVYYDTDPKWGTDDLPVLQCASCQEYFMPDEAPDESAPCPSCGAASGPPDPMTGQPTPATDLATHPQTGMPMTVQQPRGKICMRLLSSFEFSVPRSARELHEERMPWVAGHGRMDTNDVLALWPNAAAALAGNDAASQGKTSESQGVAFADQMRALSAPGGGASQQTVGGSSVSPSGPIVWFVWADPLEDDEFSFPDGLYAVLLGDGDGALVLEHGPLPFTDDKGRPFKNILIRTFQAVPGAAWGKPPGDDLLPLQKQLNLCQALAFLILMNDAAPTTYIPDTVTLLQDLTGAPGDVVPFKALRSGDKPIIQPGTGFPDSLKWFLEYLVGQFDTVSKLNAVLQGQRPQGDPTAFEVETLKERGLAAFREPLDQLVDFEKRVTRTLLHIARQCAWSPRFYTVAGENAEWDVQQFMGSDLSGSVSIQVESASAWPKSPTLQNLRLDKALQRQIINPQDPEVQATYLSLNDLSDFKASTDHDLKQVAREIDSWKHATTAQEIKQPDPLWNLPFHLFKKVNWLKTEEAEALQQAHPDVYQAIRQQVQGIQQLMNPPAPMPGPGQPGGPPPTGDAVNRAVQSGAIKPAAGPKKPDGSVLNALMKQRALTPAAGTPPPQGAGGVH